MTTGAPIYLVSACASPEEFFAAFRRYADRAGLFVPASQPVPAGKRGRFALTLKDGGVMLEGDGEVLQSSHKPQGLHGRAGMTIRFVELDDPSKVVLGELEKARLAMKPTPPKVPPRPAPVPAEPRPVPPRPGGRIDATNALAECVVIGDLSALREMGNAAPKPAIGKPTTFGMPPLQKTPAKVDPATVKPEPAKPEPAKHEAAKPEPAPSKPEPAMPFVSTKSTTLGMPAIRMVTQPFGVPTTTPPGSPPPRRSHSPSQHPLMPRQPTPVVPLPIVRPPAMTSSQVIVAPEADVAEKTDVSSSPPPPPPTVAAVAAPPAAEPPAIAQAIGGRSGGMRASEIMAAIPTDDWTMTPDAPAPTVLPPSASSEPDVVDASLLGQRAPTGDWTMSKDPAASDGWSAPLKVQPPVVSATPAATGNPVHAIPEKALNAVAWEDKPTNIGAKIEIDPTLLGSEEEIPVDAELEPVPPPPILPPMMPSAPPPPPFGAPFPNPLARPTPIGSARMPTDAGNWFKDSEQVPRYPTGETDVIEKSKRRRTLIIATSAAAAVLLVAIVIVIAVGGKKTSAATGTGSGSAGSGSGSGSTAELVVKAGSAAPGSGSGSQAAIAPGSGSGSAETKAATCTADINSAPQGAQITLDDNTALGTTPATVTLPCGVETKVWVKKVRYLPMFKAVTATADGVKVDVFKLARAMFSVKVTSAPSGATITVGGRTVGITPTTIKLPAFEASRVTLTKDGYAIDTEPFTPKANNAAFHIVLKRGPPKRH